MSKPSNRDQEPKKRSITYGAQYNINPLLTPKICYSFLYFIYIATYLSLVRVLCYFVYSDNIIFYTNCPYNAMNIIVLTSQ